MCNVIRLWDTLFADPNRFEYLNYVCVALVDSKRSEIIEGDFAECMETLQKSTNDIEDVRTLLNQANTVYSKYVKAKKDSK